MFTFILFVLGFVILIRGAVFLIDGAASIAKKFNISKIVIGLTIVAFGTSAPELAVNLISSFQGNTDLAIGNIVGSNIANILLILGIASIIYPLKVNKNTVWKEIPFSIFGAVILYIMAGTFLITRIDGLILLGFFAVFLYYTFGISKNSGKVESESELDIDTIPIRKTSTSIGMVILGLVGLALGGKWIVDGAVEIATNFGMSQSLIGLTIIAVGTSLPELATTITASLKKQSDMAIGGVVGSNIFNIFWILGISSIIRPLPVNTETNFDLLVAILASVALFIFLIIGKRNVIERWEGWIFISFYASYIGYYIIKAIL